MCFSKTDTVIREIGVHMYNTQSHDFPYGTSELFIVLVIIMSVMIFTNEIITFSDTMQTVIA